jgi:hypothetical protein
MAASGGVGDGLGFIDAVSLTEEQRERERRREEERKVFFVCLLFFKYSFLHRY